MKEEIKSWISVMKFGVLDGRKQLTTTDCGVFILVMAMEIATKGIMFDSLATIDLRDWIASHCLSDHFPRSITRWIKTQVERIAMAPRFKIDISMHVYNFQNFVTLREEKKTKLPEMKVWMIKKVRRFFFYYNDLVVAFQRLVASCEKQSPRILINTSGIYFFRIWYKKINKWTGIVDNKGPICLLSLKAPQGSGIRFIFQSTPISYSIQKTEYCYHN